MPVEARLSSVQHADDRRRSDHANSDDHPTGAEGCRPCWWHGTRSTARLDVEEQAAHDEPDDAVTPAKARHYLANPWKPWEDTEPEGRRAIAEAAFDRIDAVGLDLIVHPSAEAERYGWSDAFGSEPLACSISRSGRGERSSAHTFQHIVWIDAGAAPLRLVRSA